MAVAALAACSSGGGDVLSFDDMDTAGEALADMIEGVDVTAPATLPTTGSATYDGYMDVILGFGTVDASQVRGEMELRTSFAGAGTVTGSVTNIRDEDNALYEGTLRIDNGTVDRTADPATDVTFEADIGGTLRNSGDDYVVDGQMGGDFYGANYRYVQGLVGATVEGPGGTLGALGHFVGER